MAKELINEASTKMTTAVQQKNMQSASGTDGAQSWNAKG